MRVQFEIEYFNEAGNTCKTTTGAGGWSMDDKSWSNAELGLELSYSTCQAELGEWFYVPNGWLKETGGNRFKKLIPVFKDMERYEEDGSSMLLPFDSGMICHNAGKLENEYEFPVFNEPEEGWLPWWGNMPIWGTFHENEGILAIAEGGKFDMNLRLKTCWGNKRIYRIDPVFLIREYVDETGLGDDIGVLLCKTGGNYQSMGQCYRKYNQTVRKLPSLKEKVQSGNQDLDYSAQAMTVRCRMAVKELPTRVLEQTPETAPTPKALMRFDDISTIAEEFSRQQVGPVEFCLVGWNYGGHDGAFPQIFPVEEVCGGEAELKKAISKVHKCGYPLSLHDNYYDGYTLAANFKLDDACCMHDSFLSPAHGGGLLSGGRAYRICAEKAATKYAPQNMKDISEHFDVKGAFFSDVISIIPMLKCYHPEHPLSRRGNAEYYKQIMKLEHDTFHVSMSEGCRDWALPELDRAYMLYNNFDNKLAFVDEHVPFFPIAYHGFLIYNSSREGINAWPGDPCYLRNLAWGGLPIIYYHHIFNPGWGEGDGWENDLTFEGTEKLARDTATIKKMTDDIARISHLRYEFIEDFRCFGNSLSCTVFSDGTRLWINYSDEAVTNPDGGIVPGRDFLVV